MITTPTPTPSPSYPRSPYKSEPDTEPEEQDSPFSQHHHHPSSNKQGSPKTSKIKSSLCKNFMVGGSCPYGERCQFAHGPQELRCNRV